MADEAIETLEVKLKVRDVATELFHLVANLAVKTRGVSEVYWLREIARVATAEADRLSPFTGYTAAAGVSEPAPFDRAEAADDD